jgi:glycosyltransferase involved in cell wall biosynthesis
MNKKIPKKNIAFLITSLGFGGAETQLDFITSEVSKKDTVHIITLIEIKKSKEIKNINLINLDIKKNLYSLFKCLHFLKKFLIKNKIDTLVTFNFHPNLLGSLLKLLRIKTIIMTSIRTSFFGGYIRKKIIKFICHFSDKIIFNSKNVLNTYVDTLNVRSKNMIVIYNYTPISKISINKDHQNKNANSPFQWIAVGRIVPAKNYKNLIEAIKILKNNNYMFLLRIIGDGSNFGSIQNLINRHNLNSEIEMLGFKNNPSEYYKLSDGFVLSSSWEGFPNSLLEAVSYRLPVVSTMVGGVNEIIENGKNGIIVSPNSPNELASGMLKIMNSSRKKLNGYINISENILLHQHGFSNTIKLWVNEL